MKNYVLAGLVAAQMIVSAQPATAAGFEQGTSVQTGTFAGARIRLSLGGKQQDQKFRAGLTMAPTLRSQAISGETRMRIGEGLELGFTGKRPLNCRSQASRSATCWPELASQAMTSSGFRPVARSQSA